MVESNWMTLMDLAEYLKCSEDAIQSMVDDKKIPFSMLVGSPRFFKQAIDEWLLGQANEPVSESRFKLSEGVECNEDIVEGIKRLSSMHVGNKNYIARKAKYINFKRDRVLFQLHPSISNAYDNSECAELVLPDVDDDVPETNNLEEVEITKLFGYWRANVGWLNGDGSRYTYRPAKAFHITKEMVTDNKHEGWDEIHALLKYAMNRKKYDNNTLKYTSDSHLKFLRECNKSDLAELVKILTKGKDGEERFTEQLTGSELYIKYFPTGEHSKYWHLIAAELQKFGGNTFSNIVRGGRGVSYEAILKDVCKKVKVKVSEHDTVIDLEKKLQAKIIEITFEKMDNEELKKIFKEIDLNPDNYDDIVNAFADMIENMDEKELKEISSILDIKPTSFTKNAMIHALQIAIKQGGFKSYIYALKIMNIFSRRLLKGGARWTANRLLTKWMARFAGPIGWVVTGLWDAYDLSGPARRVTIPAVIQVAYMRASMNENG